MHKGFEYIDKHRLLIHHLTKYSIFDEVSYLLTLTMLIEKISQHKPRFILILIKNRKIFNYDLKFQHWLEMNFIPAVKAAGVEKIAFCLPYTLKNYKVPQYSEALTFEFSFFEKPEDATAWFGIEELIHLSGSEGHSVEIPL